MFSGSFSAGETPSLTSLVRVGWEGDRGRGWGPGAAVELGDGWMPWGLGAAAEGGLPALQTRCCPSPSCEELATGTTEGATSSPRSLAPQVGVSPAPGAAHAWAAPGLPPCAPSPAGTDAVAPSCRLLRLVLQLRCRRGAGFPLRLHLHHLRQRPAHHHQAVRAPAVLGAARTLLLAAGVLGPPAD